MVNNSTNINKMNNHLSPHIIDHKKDHEWWHMANKNPGPGFGQAEIWGRVKPIVT